MTELVLYHSSPNPNIKKLHANSYVTLFPHIAYIFGLYFSPKHPAYNIINKKIENIYPFGRPWKDIDLIGYYDFSPKIKFKPRRKPDKIGTMYKLKTTTDNIIFHKNFPYEMTIKKSVKVSKVKKSKIPELIKTSKTFYKFLVNC